MKHDGCILGFIAFLLAIILILLVLIKIKIIKIESYYDGQYYKKKCDKAKYFTLQEITDSPGGYFPTLARYMMQLSYNVEVSNCINLEPVPIPQGFDARIQLVGTSYDNIKRPFGYIFTSTTKNIILIAFTGTVFSDEWIEDFDSSQVTPVALKGITAGILCHAGFYDMYSSVQNQINNVVKESKPNVTVYITGHSLGGALSTFAAYDLAYLNPIVYTFGSPRVFNTIGAQKLDKLLAGRIQRVFNTEDIFTTVPLPQAFGENYEHVGTGTSFTMNLGSIPENHMDAYLKFYGLP